MCLGGAVDGRAGIAAAWIDLRIWHVCRGQLADIYHLSHDSETAKRGSRLSSILQDVVCSSSGSRRFVFVEQ